MVYLPTFTININQMKVNLPYMDPIGKELSMLRQTGQGWTGVRVQRTQTTTVFRWTRNFRYGGGGRLYTLFVDVFLLNDGKWMWLIGNFMPMFVCSYSFCSPFIAMFNLFELESFQTILAFLPWEMKIANLETAHFSVNFSRRNFEAFDSRPFTRGQHIITVDGKNPAETPVEVGTLSQYLQGFVHPRCNSMLHVP